MKERSGYTLGELLAQLGRDAQRQEAVDTKVGKADVFADFDNIGTDFRGNNIEYGVKVVLQRRDI